jgi:hypothetical protein
MFRGLCRTLSLTITVTTALFTTSGAQAFNDTEIKNHLLEFHQNPAAIMNQRPKRYDPSGNPVTQVESLFSAEAIESESFIFEKDQSRQRHCTYVEGHRLCLKDIKPGRGPFDGKDVVEKLVDNAPNVMRRLDEMEKSNLQKAQLEKIPWSDSYWPTTRGGLGFRYSDKSMPTEYDWAKTMGYITMNPPEILVISGQTSKLSPAEKYDLLLGAGWTLTNASWNRGKYFYEKNKTVERWMGRDSNRCRRPFDSVLSVRHQGPGIFDMGRETSPYEIHRQPLHQEKRRNYSR